VAVPKRKQSRRNTRARRSQWKTTAANLTTCPSCKAEKLPHTACPACGAYDGRVYVEAVKTEHER
jgi:large subunit ribosomal protein L32